LTFHVWDFFQDKSLMFKSAEQCFLEILEQVRRTNGHPQKDELECLDTTCRFSYSKLRNFSSVYKFEGRVDLANNTYMTYFFSDRRSHIGLYSTISSSSTSTYLTQDTLDYYKTLLFDNYSIDVFINNLIQTRTLEENRQLSKQRFQTRD
jgi:hypothetical protein